MKYVWPGVQHTPFVAASNPGSIGHGWVKKLWVDRDFTGDDDVFDPAHCEACARRQERPEGEHLGRMCQRCHFFWREAPLIEEENA